MLRRTLLAAAATLPAALPGAARAQSWTPNRSLRILVPQVPGGTSDTLARLIAEPLGQALGQTVVVENRPGGNQSIAAIAVARSAPDGHTILYTPPAVQILNPLMMKTVPYDAMADFTPLIAVMRAPKLLVVRADFPVNTVAELIAMAKAQPGALNFCSAGIGSSGHLAMALFMQMAGVDMVHVPYRGTAPGVQDILAGRIQLTLDSATALVPLVQDGRLRALAVSTRDRAQLAPQLPPIADTLPGYHDASFNYLLLPARTPPEVVGTLNATLNRILSEPAMKARFAVLGTEPLGGSPADLAAMVQEEIGRWRGVIAQQGITIE